MQVESFSYWMASALIILLIVWEPIRSLLNIKDAKLDVLACIIAIGALAFLLLSIASSGTAVNQLPADGNYSLSMPKDGYFVILNREDEGKPRVQETLFRINPKLVEFKTTSKKPYLEIKPRSDGDAWAGKKVTIYLPAK